MATLARSPECAIMHVILLMTRMAISGESDLGDILRYVTGVAIQAVVRPGQRISRLYVVIKAPTRPAVRIVAKATVRPQAPLVMLVRVTRRAGQ